MTQIDEAKTQAFGGRMLGDTAALLTTVLAAIGDQLGLWKDLDRRGPGTSSAIAERNGLSERHVREWLAAMSATGYVDYCNETQTFRLPPEHAPALAHEGGPMFFGGALEILLGYLKPLDRTIESFKKGGGVPQSAYPDSTYAGMERFSAGWYEHLLGQVWLPKAGLEEKLAVGISVADIGCGRGRALIQLAKRYPRSRFVGYDVYAPNVARARANAEAAGVADRVRFVELDAADGLPERFDLITTFDVVHDSVDPAALLLAIRRALSPGGTYLCLEMACSQKLEENRGPMASLFYGVSVLYCMTTSLAHGGAGLGTCGVHEPKLRELGANAGFPSVRRIEIDNPFNHLYALSV
jgi:SAM-dependent methyltransferase